MSNIRLRTSCWITSLTVLLGSVIVHSLAAEPVSSSTSSAPTRVTKSQITATMFNAPMSFEVNQGQTDPSVNFIARGSGYTLFLTPTESVMVMQQREATPSTNDVHDPLATMEPVPVTQNVVRMKLEGSNPKPIVEGQDQLPSIVNYFIGNDPAKWRTKIPTYAKVTYQEAYPGIDVAYYGNQGRLEYDFIVAPGADPNQIRIAFEGAAEMKIADSGDLLLTTALGEVRLQQPVVYQEGEGGRRQMVGASYIRKQPFQDDTVKIELAAYDVTKPLLIDPVLSFSSFLGGVGGDDASDVGIDPAGNVWVVGSTAGLLLAPTGTSYDPSYNGGPSDIFVLKVSPSGTPLVWTYIGGSSNDHTPAITFDSSGNAWLTGTTGGSFPVTPDNLQAVYQGGGDAFIVKLDPNGSTLLYATLYGTPLSEAGRSIAVNSGGTTVYLGGETTSPALPGSGGPVVQPNFAGVQDGFIAKINIPSVHIEYVTYLGGTARENLSKIKLDAAGNLHVVGQTFSTDFPGTALSSISSLASVQPNFGGGTSDAFAIKLNANGTQLLYSTYLGGNDADAGLSVALDSIGNAVVSGNTRSPNFPLAGTPFQSTRVGNDYFATKISQSGGVLIFSTYFGGIGNDSGGVVALDQSDNVYLSGQSNSCAVPHFSHPLQINVCAAGAGLPIFVGQLDPTGSSLLSLFGFTGNGSSISNGLVTDGNGSLYVAGFTRASDLMTQNAFQGTFGGGTSDAFFAKLTYRPIAAAGPDLSVSMGTLVTLDGTDSTGGSLTYAWTKLAGPTVALGGATTAHPTFVAPNVPAAGATVTFQLIVCEGASSNCSDPATVNVHIRNINQPPVAQAGPDQTVQEGSPVILDGTASYDPDIEPLTYTWLQIPTSTVTLANPNSATPSFTAPSVGAGGGQVDFELIVHDARGLVHSDFVSIVMSNVNQPPVAHAGADQTKNENTLVTLDGSGSHDPDLDGLSYYWSQIGGAGVALTGATTASPTFTAPNVAAGGAFLIFQLTVHDGHVSSVADTVQVAVVNVNDPPVCTLAQASPNLLWPPNHTMTQVSILGLTDPQNQMLTITYPTVKQDEPINGLGDGDTSPDAAVSGNDILLRAERTGNGNGRVYVVQFTATNADGAHCSGTVKVAVPHNKKDPAIEGPQLYNSFGP